MTWIIVAVVAALAVFALYKFTPHPVKVAVCEWEALDHNFWVLLAYTKEHGPVQLQVLGVDCDEVLTDINLLNYNGDYTKIWDQLESVIEWHCVNCEHSTHDRVLDVPS